MQLTASLWAAATQNQNHCVYSGQAAIAGTTKHTCKLNIIKKAAILNWSCTLCYKGEFESIQDVNERLVTVQANETTLNAHLFTIITIIILAIS